MRAGLVQPLLGNVGKDTEARGVRHLDHKRDPLTLPIALRRNTDKRGKW